MPRGHFAADWEKTQIDDYHDVAEITELGVRYKTLPVGEEREAIALKLIKCFHSYLMKYLNLIICGRLETFPGRQTIPYKDTVMLLQFFLPRDTAPTAKNLNLVARNLHLAFKGVENDEIYNILVGCLLQAIEKYDPGYADRCHETIRGINQVSDSNKPEISLDLLEESLGFSPLPYLKLLKKKGFLSTETDKNKQVWMKTESWPPPAKFLNSGPVGLPYYITKWFRYLFRAYITKTMAQIESKKDVLQLDHRKPTNPGADIVRDMAIPNQEGAFQDPYARAWHADTELMDHRTEDIGTMDLEWVQTGKGKAHFESLSKNERLVLYLVFKQDQDFKRVAKALNMPVAQAKEYYEEILDKLRTRMKL